MKSPRTITHPASVTVMLILFGWILIGLVESLIIRDMIGQAHRGEHAWVWLNDQISTRMSANPAWEDVSHVEWVARTMMSRLGLVWTGACLLGVAFLNRRTLFIRLKAFFLQPDSALNLAILRVVTFGMIATSTSAREEIVQHTGLPDILLHPISGLGPLLTTMLPSEPSVNYIVIAWATMSVAACFGFLTRFSTIASLLLSLYVMGIPQLYGKVNHMHHLMWFAAIRASSRCGDVFSLDSLIRRRGPAPAPSPIYGLPLRFAWLLLGIVYFFPGIWKIWTGGIDWIWSDHLRNQIWHQWSTFEEWRPLIDPTGWAMLPRLGGLSVIGFELTFILMMFSSRTRMIAAFAGLAFHISNLLVLNIGFFSLMISYIILFNWPAILRSVGIRSIRLGIPARPEEDSRPPRASLLAVAIVGTAVMIPNIHQGIIGNNYGWPFACYPKFGYPMFKPERHVIDVELISPDGQSRDMSFIVGEGRVRNARWHGMTKKALNTRDPELRIRRIEALRRMASGDVPSGSRIRFLRSTYSTDPHDRGSPPIRQVEIGRFMVP